MIKYQGEMLYVFDLTSTEVFLPQVKDPNDPNAKPKRTPPMYPGNWRDSFGLPVAQHSQSMQIDLMEGYETAATNIDPQMMYDEKEEEE